jgi:hypothetical protein
VTASCGHDSLQSHPQIAFGNRVNEGDLELSYAVKVLTEFGSCTGAIVGPRHVITAAECLGRYVNLDDEPIYKLSPFVKVIALAGGRLSTINVAQAVQHPQYSALVKSSVLSTTLIASVDISLLELDSPLPANGVAIAQREQTLSKPLKLTGYGLDENNRTVSFPKIAVGKSGWQSTLLSNGYGIVGFIKGEDAGVPCAGDKGAPAVSDGFLVGLVSMVVRRVPNVCTSTESAMLTDVRLQRKWLNCSSSQMQSPLSLREGAQSDPWCDRNVILNYPLK